MRISYKKIMSLMLFVYIVLKPFYLWSSGLPQLSDLILMLLVIFTLLVTGIKINISHKKIGVTLALFIYYIILINSIWYFMIGSSKLIFSSLFLIFNALAMYTVMFIYQKYKEVLLVTLYKSIVFSVLIQLLLISFFSSGTGREYAFFNNPNQLAYYGLLCLAFLFVIEKKVEHKPLTLFLTIIGSVALIILSISKAAIAAAIGMFCIFAFKYNKGKIMKIVYRMSSIFIVIFSYLLITTQSFMYGKSRIIDLLLYRIAKDSDDKFILEGRGYDRIFNHLEYLIFGAGEGEYERFITDIPGLELHSTLGNILFSYGIIGFILFSIILINLLRRKNSYTLTFLLIYGLTHNGIRNTLLWIFMGVLLVSEEPVKKFFNRNKKKRKNLLYNKMEIDSQLNNNIKVST